MKADVERGAAFLDKKEPGWFERIDVDKLDMSEGDRQPDGCGCVGAQLYGEYDEALYVWGVPDDNEVSFGFNLADMSSSPRWTWLRKFWVEQIERRRNT